MGKTTTRKQPNQFKVMLALTKASIISTLRSPTSLFFNFFFPFIFIAIFGSISGSNMTFDLAIRPDSLKEGSVYEALESISALNIIDGRSDQELDEDLKKGRIAVVIDIQESEPLPIGPDEFMNTYTVDIERSAANQDGASTIIIIMNQAFDQFNEIANGDRPLIVSTSETVIEGRKFQSIDFILPGQLAFTLSIRKSNDLRVDQVGIAGII